MTLFSPLSPSHIAFATQVSLISPDPNYGTCNVPTAPVERLGVPRYMWLVETNTGVASACMGPNKCATTFPGPPVSGVVRQQPSAVMTTWVDTIALFHRAWVLLLTGPCGRPRATSFHRSSEPSGAVVVALPLPNPS